MSGSRLWSRGSGRLGPDAAALPFATGSFDACRSERMLQHVPDAGAVVREMLRVLKPGGRIVVLDSDWNTLSIDSPEPELERAFVRFFSRRLLKNGSAGRQLFRLLAQARVRDIRAEAFPVVWTDYRLFLSTSMAVKGWRASIVESGALSEAEVRCLVSGFRRAQGKGVFFASGCMIAASGRKEG